jgi:hypothetical protein
MHPKISPALPALFEEGFNSRRPCLGAGRRLAEQRWGRLAAARPYDAFADEPQYSPLCGVKVGRHRFEACDGPSPVDDEYRRSAFEAIDQRTEIVFGFGNTGFLHLSIMANCNQLFKLDD